mmetsp:Transcript_27560/g.69778  ORF Transcript_27560/g.69778 Transcript_27560/m.69778 type:complete len:292 (+) Transcript_27560:1369-2244(+)
MKAIPVRVRRRLLLLLAHVRVRPLVAAEGPLLSLGRHLIGHFVLHVARALVAVALPLHRNQRRATAGGLIGHERTRVADHGEGPVEALGDRHEDEVLVEEVDVLGPPLDALEALANGDGVLAAYRLLERLEQPLVEEGVEEVAARQLRLAVRLRSQPLLDALELVVDERVVEELLLVQPVALLLRERHRVLGRLLGVDEHLLVDATPLDATEVAPVAAAASCVPLRPRVGPLPLHRPRRVAGHELVDRRRAVRPPAVQPLPLPWEAARASGARAPTPTRAAAAAAARGLLQ